MYGSAPSKNLGTKSTVLQQYHKRPKRVKDNTKAMYKSSSGKGRANTRAEKTEGHTHVGSRKPAQRVDRRQGHERVKHRADAPERVGATGLLLSLHRSP